jgi:hypothetical protein
MAPLRQALEGLRHHQELTAKSALLLSGLYRGALYLFGPAPKSLLSQLQLDWFRLQILLLPRLLVLQVWLG